MVQVWDLVTGRKLCSLEGHTGAVTALAFAIGGKRLVSGGRDGALNAWDVVEGREVLRFVGPPAGPDALAFHPDGRRLAVARGSEVDCWGSDGP
jgi:WD40 repeat protein